MTNSLLIEAAIGGIVLTVIVGFLAFLNYLITYNNGDIRHKSFKKF